MRGRPPVSVARGPAAVTRRSVLLGGAALAASACVPREPPVFSLGIASGDPLPTGVVLWTRLAVEPLAEDGRGGMPDRTIPVEYQVAEDEQFTRIVRTGQAWAAPELAHSVHVDVDGLRPDAEYFYRFRAGAALSTAGRTRTAPAPGTLSALTLCFASCANYGHGYFTAYRRLAEDRPDLVVFLGDYQYEYAAAAADVRRVVGPETVTLADYRRRYAQYKTDPDLRFAHAAAPWIAVWDDHETVNDWTGNPAYRTRRAASFQAYYENMPLRAKPTGADMRLYRRLSWGDLATFHLLDTRQYRDDQACGDGIRAGCAQRLDPARTITGAAQERWLVDGLRQSAARWDVLGQQVVFAEMDRIAGPVRGYNLDAWDGYPANRDRITAAMTGLRNGVVLTGDVHRHYAAEIAHEGRPAGVELVTTSITSERDGDEGTGQAVLGENPHVKFYKNRRGYVRVRITPSQLQADYRVLPYVSRPGAPVETAASFLVPDRESRLHRM